MPQNRFLRVLYYGSIVKMIRIREDSDSAVSDIVSGTREWLLIVTIYLARIIQFAPTNIAKIEIYLYNELYENAYN